jgi:hypothetical protein
MSDAITDISSVTSFGDISVCEEIGQLIEQCESLYQHIHNSSESLKNIHSLIENKNNIIVTYNEWTGDFDELLKLFHQDAINNIKDGNPNMFSHELLKMLNNTIFH